MASVGATLRSVRERQGRAISDIAEELCLTQQYVKAIEQDDLKTLPGAFFYRNFVRQYAAILGMDPAQLRSQVDALTFAEETALIAIAAPSPLVIATNRRYFDHRSLGVSVAGLAGVVLACSVFYAWWEKPRLVAKPPVIQTIPVPVQQTAAVPASPVPVVVSTPDAEIMNHVALNLSATEKTWLSISSGGKQIFSGILEPSQTKTVTGLDMAQMKVGNAGGIEVQLNGKPIGPIGPRGQVRVVEFTPDHFEILPTPPPSPEAL
jgi:cytoskeleton protein RodZ